jgi:hypothetical protein
MRHHVCSSVVNKPVLFPDIPKVLCALLGGSSCKVAQHLVGIISASECQS